MPKSSALNDTPFRTVELLVQPLRALAAAHPRKGGLTLKFFLYCTPYLKHQLSP